VNGPWPSCKRRLQASATYPSQVRGEEGCSRSWRTFSWSARKRPDASSISSHLRYGKRDDGAIRGTQLFQDSLSRFRGIKVAGERSNDAIALLLGIHEQESVEKVLLNQCRVNQFVRWSRPIPNSLQGFDSPRKSRSSGIRQE